MGMHNKERRRAKRSKARAHRPTATNPQRGTGSRSSGEQATRSDEELAANIVQVAAHSKCCGVGGRDVLMAELARSPDHVVERQLQYRLRTELARLLQNGWDPLDLWEVSRRRASAFSAALAAGLMLAAVSASGVRERVAAWTSECSILDDACPLDPAAPDWPAQVDAGIDLIGVLEHLGVLSRLDGMAAGPAAPEDPQQASLLAKIKALLAKAESSEFVDEADSFTAKATELMLRHRIDRAALEANSGVAGRSQVIARRCWIEPPYVEHKSLLCHVVAKANDCRSVRHDYGFMTLVGHADDVDLTELLFASLLVQATRQMTAVGVAAHEAEAVAKAHAKDRYAWLERTGNLPPDETEEGIRRLIEPTVARQLEKERRKPSFRRSFLVAYATRIDQRLEELHRDTTAAAEAEIGASFLPVLARQQQEVDDAVADLFGDELVSSRVRTYNYAGWAAGAAAAELADLNVRDELWSRGAASPNLRDHWRRAASTP